MTAMLDARSTLEALLRSGGGKAANLHRLCAHGFPVPAWFCVPAEAFAGFVSAHRLDEQLRVPAGKDLAAFSKEVERVLLERPLDPELERALEAALRERGLDAGFVAVRSSGLDEDSAGNSFAGQFSSFLYQQGMPAIGRSLRACWASAFSERALSYRLERRLPLDHIEVGVVIQRMVDAEAAGVAFSRDPIHPLDRDSLIISSVWGLGEGLVSGELDADHFHCRRKDLALTAKPAEKTWALRQAPEGGLRKVELAPEQRQAPSLDEGQVRAVAQMTLELERKLGAPQDCEWAIAQGLLQLLQTRPITTLPGDAYFDPAVNGESATLWDNSNIIESYSGVTSPLTFSFASAAYRQVYLQFCEVMGVPRRVVAAHESMFRNMLGLLRGRIYYNLINWYRLVLLLPGAGSNQGFMETMMGVRQQLRPELAGLFEFMRHPPRYSPAKKLAVGAMTLWRFLRFDAIVRDFQGHFNAAYQEARKTDFDRLSLPDLVALYQGLDERVLRRWHAPIINDYLCMIFFGLLKKLTEGWVAGHDAARIASLQNDLLCGEGDLESTEPTKLLMKIAERVDNGDAETRRWFLDAGPAGILRGLKEGRSPELQSMLADFLDRYGFRCVNELKLEEPDLHDDPSFVLDAVASYVRMKSYSIRAMEEREREIRAKAEALVVSRISGLRRAVYFWVLRQARRAVKTRENLRFDRTKIFGVVRHLFRAMGRKLAALGALRDGADVFYLTVDELFAWIEGRGTNADLEGVAALRKREYQEYRKTPAPPDRLLTRGAAGAALRMPQVLADADLLRQESAAPGDPNVLVGTPCCPGVVEGVVRVVHGLEDARGIAGEILVTARTDPGWVPLYPSCSGLLIERGSLLSHSAVVARELGLPTIVGISNGLMTRLKTGQRVRVDAGKGEVRILS